MTLLKRMALLLYIAWRMQDVILLKRWIVIRPELNMHWIRSSNSTLLKKNCTQQQLLAAERALIRQEQSLPILKLLREWMRHEYELVLPKSPIGKALAYSLKHWDKLSTYVTDGRLHIDNNAVENSIRPVAVGRKNYLFSGSHEAAKRSAMLYSLLGTCKLHHINPATWLPDVLSRISAHPKKDIVQLLPHNWILQQK